MREQRTNTRKGQAGAVPADALRSLGYLKNNPAEPRALDMKRGAVWAFLEPTQRQLLAKALDYMEQRFVYDQPRGGHTLDQFNMAWPVRLLLGLLQNYGHNPEGAQELLEHHESHDLIQGLELVEHHCLYHPPMDGMVEEERLLVEHAKRFLNALRQYREECLRVAVQNAGAAGIN